jgi:dipeptidyl-peptidase-4
MSECVSRSNTPWSRKVRGASCAAGLLLGFVATAILADVLEPYQPAEVQAADYDRAVALLSRNIQGTVRNTMVTPHWFPGRNEFWYVRETADGIETVIVDADTGAKRPAFDHQQLSAALNEIGDGKFEPTALDIVSIRFDGNRQMAEVRSGSGVIQCDLAEYTCEALPAWRLDPFQVTAPDGQIAAFRHDHDVWVRVLADGTERRLTDDGEEHYSWGAMPGWGPILGLMRQGLDGPLVGAAWSPDGAFLVVPKVDERQVRDYPYYDSVPANDANRPQVLNKRIGLVGDEHREEFEMFVLDVASGEQKAIPLPQDCRGELGSFPPQALWTDRSDRVFFICIAPDASKVELIGFDPASGGAQLAWREISDSWIDLNHSLYQSLGANVRLLDHGNRAIIFSQRDGWGHLYLVDTESGETIRQLTRGEWVVHDIVHVDEEEGWVYYTAGGREPGRNPYWRHVYRSSLDGTQTALLTPEEADHATTVAGSGLLGAVSTFAPDGEYYVDNQSTIDMPPVATLRRADGSAVATLEKADASALFARGYEPPESFSVKAVDGETDIYGVIYRPKNLQAGLKYPVIEHIYGGPQTNLTPRTFTRAAGLDRIGGQGDTSVFTELGFAVVLMDVRGTPWRSKQFHDYTWKKHDEFAIEDHVAALRQLGERFPWLDLDRVGITGHSWGGYASTLAMLRYPDFYKVAVSSAGPYDYRYLYPAFVKWTGWPQYEDGTRIAPDETARLVNLQPAAALVENLAGKLLIVYGEHDENTLPASTLTFVDALIDAGKDFDLLMLPNRDHFFTNEPYFIRRRMDYFVEYLLGARPPVGYHINRESPR